MSKYTIKLQEICEWLIDHKDDPEINSKIQNTWGGGFETDLPNPFKTGKNDKSIDDIIEEARPLLFNFTYPIFNEDNKGDERKKELETKIIKHYYLYEIGFETYMRFNLALDEAMNRIMPFYNEMYKSVYLQGDNPLTNMDFWETRDTQNKNNMNTQTQDTTDNTGRSVFQDTPTQRLGDEDYATNITDITNNTNSNGTTTNNEDLDEKMQRHVLGLNQYSKQDMITRFRDNIINVDEMIIEELHDLFMLIY